MMLFAKDERLPLWVNRGRVEPTVCPAMSAFATVIGSRRRKRQTTLVTHFCHWTRRFVASAGHRGAQDGVDRRAHSSEAPVLFLPRIAVRPFARGRSKSRIWPAGGRGAGRAGHPMNTRNLTFLSATGANLGVKIRITQCRRRCGQCQGTGLPFGADQKPFSSEPRVRYR